MIRIISNARKWFLIAIMVVAGSMTVTAQNETHQYFTVDEMPDLLRNMTKGQVPMTLG